MCANTPLRSRMCASTRLRQRLWHLAGLLCEEEWLCHTTCFSDLFTNFTSCPLNTPTQLLTTSHTAPDLHPLASVPPLSPDALHPSHLTPCSLTCRPHLQPHLQPHLSPSPAASPAASPDASPDALHPSHLTPCTLSPDALHPSHLTPCSLPSSAASRGWRTSHAMSAPSADPVTISPAC